MSGFPASDSPVRDDRKLPAVVPCAHSSTAGILPQYTHENIIPKTNVRATTIPRPPFESSPQGKFKSAFTIFV